MAANSSHCLRLHVLPVSAFSSSLERMYSLAIFVGSVWWCVVAAPIWGVKVDMRSSEGRLLTWSDFELGSGLIRQVASWPRETCRYLDVLQLDRGAALDPPGT